MSRNIAAFTPMCGSGEYYPAYISINRASDAPGTDIEITVRGPEKAPHVCGPEAKITMSAANFRALMTEAVKRDDPGRPVPRHGSGP